MDLAQALAALVDGLDADGTTLRATDVRDTRIGGKQACAIVADGPDGPARVLDASVFHGAAPVYRPWVELMGMVEEIPTTKGRVPYIDSPVEDAVLSHFAAALAAGSWLYVGYDDDVETRRQLNAGVPVECTRLGHKMFRLGCTWFKDWYHPEGGMEGGMKLQGEMTRDAKAKARHHARILDDVEAFLAMPPDGADPELRLERALARAEDVRSVVG